MKNVIYIFAFLFLFFPQLAEAQTSRNPCYTTGASSTNGVPNCIGVGSSTPLPVIIPATQGFLTGPATAANSLSTIFNSQYPMNTVTTVPTPVGVVATGTTGAVVATFAAAANQTNFLCEFEISAIGGTAAIGPVVIAGLNGGSRTIQLSSSAAGIVYSKNFSPCIPASAVNVAITITTTADGTATAVNVNASGYKL